MRIKRVTRTVTFMSTHRLHDNLKNIVCNCKICHRHREFIRHLVSIGNDDAVVFFEGIYEDLTHAEMDRDVNQAIINGSWPSADERIEFARNG